MEQTLNCCISENEDIITVGAGVTLSVMAESELLKREAKPLFDAAVMLTGRGKEALEDTAVDTAMETSEDKDTGVKAPTICDEIFQNVNCGFTGSAVPCIKEGGTECHALWEKGCAFSVMGGKAVGTTSCVSACPVGIKPSWAVMKFTEATGRRPFTYQETADQLTTIDEVKSDMERSVPMDRLIVVPVTGYYQITYKLATDNFDVKSLM